MTATGSGSAIDEMRSNSVPSTGVHEKYQFIPLSGEANFVLALLEPVAGVVSKAGSA